MAKEILVPLKRSEGIKEVVPYIERIAEPGMKVVFLFRYPVDGFDWLQARLATMQSGMQSAVQIQRMVAGYSWEQQSQLAKQKVSSAREALHKRGVEVAVELCTESFRKAVRSYTLKGDVHLIVMPTGSDHLIMRLLHSTIRFFSPLSRLSSPHAIVLHPGAVLYIQTGRDRRKESWLNRYWFH